MIVRGRLGRIAMRGTEAQLQGASTMKDMGAYEVDRRQQEKRLVITPTPGRVVWYWPSAEDPTPKFKGEPLAAHIARVKGDRLVNLMVIGTDGLTYGRHDVLLVQEGDDRPTAVGRFCEWMPYQKGQAAKTEQLERARA